MFIIVRTVSINFIFLTHFQSTGLLNVVRAQRCNTTKWNLKLKTEFTCSSLRYSVQFCTVSVVESNRLHLLHILYLHTVLWFLFFNWVCLVFIYNELIKYNVLHWFPAFFWCETLQQSSIFFLQIIFINLFAVEEQGSFRVFSKATVAPGPQNTTWLVAAVHSGLLRLPWVEVVGTVDFSLNTCCRSQQSEPKWNYLNLCAGLAEVNFSSLTKPDSRDREDETKNQWI